MIVPGAAGRAAPGSRAARLSAVLAPRRPGRGRDRVRLSHSAGHGLRRCRGTATGGGPVGDPARVGDLRRTRLVADLVGGPRIDDRPDDGRRHRAARRGRYRPLRGARRRARDSVGLFALVAWVARLGFVADLLSRPVLIGYLTGVALIMVAGQLGKITGVPVNGRTFIAEITSFARGVVHVRTGSLVVAVLVLVFLFLIQSRWPQVPGPLLAVLLATLAVAVFRLDRHGIAVIGTIPVACLLRATAPSPR